MKLITFNLRHDANRWQERFPLVISELTQEQPDIIALQEVALRINQAHQITTALHEHGLDYQVKVAPKWTRPWLPAFTERILRRREGIAVFVRQPHQIKTYRRIPLPEGHRIAQHVQIEVNGKSINLMNTHLHHQPIDDDVIRLRQMREILKYIQQSGINNWVLVGDFNALPTSQVLKITHENFQSVFTLAGLPIPDHTFPSPLVAHELPDFPNVCIDYILCQSSAFTVTNPRVIFNTPHPDDSTLYPSDHFGLSTTITHQP